MKPVDEHCRTQRLNFLFFLLRSSLSVHVAMKTGSSSIRGSCSTCNCQEKRGEGKKQKNTWLLNKMVLWTLPRKYNSCIVLVHITSYKGAKPLLFSATIQQNPKLGQARSIVDGCSTRGLQTLQGTALTSHYQLQFNIHLKCGLYLSLSSATVQHPSKMRCGVGVVSSILLQASSSASSCLAECLPPKHPLQYVVKYTPWLQQSKIHSKEGKKLREKKIFSAAT